MVLGMATEPMDLHAALGLRLRELRDLHGLTADAVAQAARRRGLSWGRSTVASIETGRRALKLEEFLVLPLILQQLTRSDEHPYGLDFGLADLAPVPAPPVPVIRPSGDFEGIRLADRLGMWPEDLAEYLSGRRTVGHFVPLMTHEEYERVRGDDAGREILRQELVSTRGDDAPDRAGWTSSREAEVKAAKALGVLSGLVGPASYILWGRGLTEERDARVAERLGPDDGERTRRTRRGHVTRELVGELRRMLVERGIIEEDT